MDGWVCGWMGGWMGGWMVGCGVVPGRAAKAMEHDVQSREGALTEAQRVEQQLR